MKSVVSSSPPLVLHASAQQESVTLSTHFNHHADKQHPTQVSCTSDAGPRDTSSSLARRTTIIRQADIECRPLGYHHHYNCLLQRKTEREGRTAGPVFTASAARAHQQTLSSTPHRIAAHRAALLHVVPSHPTDLQVAAASRHFRNSGRLRPAPLPSCSSHQKLPATPHQSPSS